MDLTIEQWKEILDAVNSNESDILEQIKVKLQGQFKAVYGKWEQKSFDVNYLFNISLTKGDERQELTLLHLAAYNGKLEIVKYLLEKKKADVNLKDNDDWTALDFAAKNDKLEIVKYLLEKKKADVNLVEDTYGESPLCYVTGNRHDSIVELLEARKTKLKDSEIEKSKCNPKAQGNSYPGKNNPAPQNAKSRLPAIAASMLAITGVISGIAIAVSLEMLAVGIAVGACCLADAAIIYCCSAPSNSLEKTSAKVAINKCCLEASN